MRFHQAAQLFSDLPNQQSVLLLGPPGIGKTALARAVASHMAEKASGGIVEGHDYEAAVAAEAAHVAELMKVWEAENAHKKDKSPAPKPRQFAIVEVRDLCSHLPEDLLGLPFRDSTGITQYAPPAWLARLSKPGMVGVLVLDDLAAASPAVQTAAFKLVLERRTGDCALGPGVKIIATANRRDDKSGATMLPAALRNRCLISTLEPDLEEWCKWAAEANIPGEVPAFLRYKSAYLSRLPKDALELGSFATPRTWEMVGRALKTAKDHENILQVAQGLVGEGTGVEFAAFCKLRTELPNPKEILFDPQGKMPDPPTSKNADRLIAVVTAVSEVAAPLSNEKGGSGIAAQLLTCLNWVCKGGKEYAGYGIITYANNGGNVAQIIKATRDGRQDPRYKDLLGHLKGSLLAQIAGGKVAETDKSLTERS